MFHDQHWSLFVTLHLSLRLFHPAMHVIVLGQGQPVSLPLACLMQSHAFCSRLLPELHLGRQACCLHAFPTLADAVLMMR
jgi:hypothetical protein